MNSRWLPPLQVEKNTLQAFDPPVRNHIIFKTKNNNNLMMKIGEQIN